MAEPATNEFFNIFVDTYDGQVTAKITHKTYKGLVCKVDSWESPEDAFNKLKEACIHAIENDFSARHDKILKYIKNPIEEAQIELDFDKELETGYNSSEDKYDECLSCQ